VRDRKAREEALLRGDPAVSEGPANGEGNGQGNGHTGDEASGRSGPRTAADAPRPAAAAFTDTPPTVPAKLQGLDLGPACAQCGGMMQRTGSCYTCSSCGNNTGCG
jgi:ribonucleoside-diphosphate reductase alpha chain